MFGLLFVGGEGPAKRVLDKFIQNVSYVIAADSGFDLALQHRIEPDLVVGDMDSVRSLQQVNVLPPEKIIRYSHNKDETDTEIGLRLFREKGFEYVIIAGGGGGRIDHLFGIKMLFSREYTPKTWITRYEHIQLIQENYLFEGGRGDTVSFFPIAGTVEGMHTEGLKWPLDGIRLKPGYGSISNVITGKRMVVRVKSGKLLMIRRMVNNHVENE